MIVNFNENQHIQKIYMYIHRVKRPVKQELSIEGTAPINQDIQNKYTDKENQGHHSHLGKVGDVVVSLAFLAEVHNVHLDAAPDFGQGLQGPMAAAR